MKKGIRRRRPVIGMGFVLLDEIVQSPTVRRDVAGKSPLRAKNLVHQYIAGAAGLSPKTVIGAHDPAHPAVDHQFPEGGQIGVPEVVGTRPDIDAVPLALGSAVDGKCLAQADSLR